MKNAYSSDSNSVSAFRLLFILPGYMTSLPHISEQDEHDAGLRINMFGYTSPGRLAVTCLGNQAADLQAITTAAAA